MTELKGNYQVALELSMEELKNMARAAGMGAMMMGGPGMGPGAGAGPGCPEANRAPADAASAPSAPSSIFTAIHQLGLKLDARKAPMEMLVIDTVEKAPTEN